jgi:spermidine synthase
VLSQTAARSLFVLSGAAALLYQIVWQRLLVLFSGSDIYSSTLVIASFMTGLGIGHAAGGHVADRRSPRNCLLWFAVAEAGIALFGLFSSFLYYDVLYQRLGPAGLRPALIAPILFVSLLWPTFFMGVSLPLLARAMTENLGLAAKRIGELYGLNTLGAAAGALVATWMLLPRFGLEGTLWIGAAVNLVCAGTVLQSLRRPVIPVEAAPPPAPVASTASESGAAAHWQPTFLVWAVVYGFAGFLALSLEIVWFRLLGVIVKSTAFTFGTLLSMYLAGLAAGSIAGTRYVNRFRRPAAVFLVLQGTVGLTAGLALSIFLGLVARVDVLNTYLAGYEPLNVGQNLRRLQLRPVIEGRVFTDPAQSLPWEAALLYVVVPAFLIAPPTFLMGFAFPVLQRVVQTDFARLGRHVGALLLANIAGSVAGTLLTGWLALNLLGTAGTIKVLLGMSALFPLLALRALPPVSPLSRRTPLSGRPGAAALAVGVALILLVSPGAEALWATLHGARVDQIVFAEDATGLSVLRLEGTTVKDRTTVFVNGIGQSWMPYAGIHSALGLLPAFIHPDPRQIAVIGLGSGDTVYAAAGRPGVEAITCIEIVRPQLETLATLAGRYPYEGLLGLLSDPRIRHVPGDGRLALMRSTARFDIIEADALRPTSAYSGNLFSDGYFELMRRRLRPQGLAVTWSPTVRVHNAFVRVFPHVVALPEFLIGSNEPISVDRQAVVARLRDPRARAHYARAGIPADELVAAHLVELARYTPEFDRGTLTDFNTDLFPRDELDRPAAPWHPAGDR